MMVVETGSQLCLTTISGNVKQASCWPARRRVLRCAALLPTSQAAFAALRCCPPAGRNQQQSSRGGPPWQLLCTTARAAPIQLRRLMALLQVRLLPCDRSNTAQRFAQGAANGTYASVVSGRCLQMLDNSFPDEGLRVSDKALVGQS
jgi:hypothetical protein